MRLIAVSPRDAHGPRVWGVHHGVCHLKRDMQQKNAFFLRIF